MRTKAYALVQHPVTVSAIILCLFDMYWKDVCIYIVIGRHA